MTESHKELTHPARTTTEEGVVEQRQIASRQKDHGIVLETNIAPETSMGAETHEGKDMEVLMCGRRILHFRSVSTVAVSCPTLIR